MRIAVFKFRTSGIIQDTGSRLINSISIIFLYHIDYRNKQFIPQSYHTAHIKGEDSNELQIIMATVSNEDCCKQCSRKVDSIKILIQEGASLFAEDGRGLTPLHYAVEHNDFCAIKALIASGIDINSDSIYYCATILNFAIRHAELNTVALLIDLGADLQKVDYYGRSAIHTAAVEGCIDIMKFISSKGIDLEMRDLRGITPLHLAAWFGHDKAIEWLLDQGVSIGLKDKSGWTALHFAAEWDRIAAARVLLVRAADVNAPDLNCHTALYWAKYCGHKAMSELLISYGGIDNVFHENDT